MAGGVLGYCHRFHAPSIAKIPYTSMAFGNIFTGVMDHGLLTFSASSSSM